MGRLVGGGAKGKRATNKGQLLLPPADPSKPQTHFKKLLLKTKKRGRGKRRGMRSKLEMRTYEVKKVVKAWGGKSPGLPNAQQKGAFLGTSFSKRGQPRKLRGGQ